MDLCDLGRLGTVARRFRSYAAGALEPDRQKNEQEKKDNDQFGGIELNINGFVENFDGGNEYDQMMADYEVSRMLMTEDLRSRGIPEYRIDMALRRFDRGEDSPRYYDSD